MKAVDFITAKHLIELERANHVVWVYPRKHIAEVDGHKKYKVSAGTVNKWSYYKKHGHLC